MPCVNVIHPGFARTLRALTVALLFCVVAQTASAEISRFVGQYTGSAVVSDSDGSEIPRDMSVTIKETKKGFSVKWTTTTYKTRDRIKETTFEINFVPTDRDGVFAAAMKRNVFGHEAQLDPMQGEPYVWARIDDETLTVFSLFVNDSGGYEMQQFDRTLAAGGLDLKFTRTANGKETRTTEVFLEEK
ncbi:hypothetical protein [Sedimentitalea todarodis]|uniref:Uncharacterized protein n=1 Tax=Sedimentitalea todarodis TaxID=1631240 RepID=A0ABU3VCG0_9RHOB|nr:hypothetical protein [Sedimentitalea todarodis]MDU9003851.1 hypothetical protein [Sedimentitalea todarodis]